MGEPVVPEETLNSVRAAVLAEHGYTTQPVDADSPPVEFVYVCKCGETGEAEDREALMKVVERHLDRVLRRAFTDTIFEGEVGTTRLRGFEKHVHDSLR